MRKAVCGVLLLLVHAVTFAQGVHPVTGRHYAGVMGVGGADWLVRPEREAEEHPDEALEGNDVPGKCALRDQQRIGGRSEAAVLGDALKGAQGIQRQPASIDRFLGHSHALQKVTRQSLCDKVCGLRSLVEVKPELHAPRR